MVQGVSSVNKMKGKKFYGSGNVSIAPFEGASSNHLLCGWYLNDGNKFTVMTEKIIEVGGKDTSDIAGQADKVIDRRQAEIEKMYSPHRLDFTPIIFSLSILVVIYLGWKAELENYITPESGLGYALGITGGIMMLLLLLYPLRKRVKWMRDWGAIRYWFKIHMILGIIGPVFILFHCNFQLASKNGSIALFSMLLMVASGIVGRYLYGRIHYGLYGSEMTLQQLQQDKLITRDGLSRLFQISPQLHERIKKYDNVLESEAGSLIAGFYRFVRLFVHTSHSYSQARRELIGVCREIAVREGWSHSKTKEMIGSGQAYLSAHFSTIRKIAGFTFFERLFSFWHHLHIPLFCMLIITVTVHIIAVHRF